MLITICRLYDSYSDANRVVLMLEAAGLPASETSVISNNSDTWYSAPKNAGVVPVRKDGTGSEADSKGEGAIIGAAIGATAATAASLTSPCSLYPVSALSSAPDGLLRCWAVWRSAAWLAACLVR